jgi:hypothetical protein
MTKVSHLFAIVLPTEQVPEERGRSTEEG